METRLSRIDSAAKPLGSKIHYEKYHQNTLAKNKDGLYAILKRRVSSPFSSNLKMGGFAAESKLDFMGKAPSKG